jgi:hypothetical protein
MQNEKRKMQNGKYLCSGTAVFEVLPFFLI